MVENGDHVNFFVWRQNYIVIEGLREEMDKLIARVARYVEEKYPASIALIPKPHDKKLMLQNFVRVADCLLKTLSTGEVFENWQSEGKFNGLRSNTLKATLKDVYDKIQCEASDKENILLSLDGESELIKQFVSDVVRVLIQFRFILNKAFSLEDHINQQYHDFEEVNIARDLYFLNPDDVLEKQREKYPRLFSSMSNDTVGMWDLSRKDTVEFSQLGDGDGSPSIRFSKGRTLKRKLTMGLVKMLPVLEQTEGDYPNKIEAFIAKLKTIFDDFYENTLGPYTTQHHFFKEICDRFREMGTEELNVLEKGQVAVYNVQVNHLFYNKEIRPLTNVYKYLHVLNSWGDKSENMGTIRESMNTCHKAIQSLEQEKILRGGIEIQIIRYKQIQSMVSNSVNIVIDLLSLGGKLNEKEIGSHLGRSLRIEEGSLEKFIKSFEEKFQALYDSYKLNSDLVEESTGQLLEGLQDFVEKLLSILKLIQNKYKTIFRIISDGLRPYGDDFFEYIAEIYNEVKTFADEFCDTLNDISKMAIKPTWLIKSLDNFYHDVVLKDFSVFSRLYEQVKNLTEFTNEFKEEFVEKEIKQMAKYRNIEDSDPTHCDKHVVRCDILQKGLSEFCTLEEIVCRPELKSIIGVKLKQINAMKKMLISFAVVYSMGRKLSDNVNVLVKKTNIPDVYEVVVKIDIILQDIVNHLLKEVEGAKALDKDYSALFISVNLESILKNEILLFYMECKKVFEHFRLYLQGIFEFYQELKRKYKNQVYLLRDDWVGFVKDEVTKNFVMLDKKAQVIESEYHEIKERLGQVLQRTQAKVKSSRHSFLEVVKRVEYLNEYFFNEWFFNFSEEEKDVGDKLYPRMKKLIKNIKLPKYKTATKLRLKLEKKAELVDTCDKCIKDLGNPKFVKAVFDGIKGWNVVAEYHGRKNIGAWKQIIDFALSEIIKEKEGGNTKLNLKEKVSTPEELYAMAEQHLNCTLTDIQKDFLEAIYTLPLQEN